MVAILRTEGLSKRFGSIQAVDDLGLTVEEGDIYGFIGLNGAGKTTSIRMILRLIRPDRGKVEIFGKDVGRSFIEIMRDIGSLVELPAYYPHLSAVKNLEIIRIINGGIKKKRIDDVLQQVGLHERRHWAVRTYSQGMRQRLAIAMALLPKPRLMILDEPTNGLDPQGISEIRALIDMLNREKGITFLISSHLLHEIERTCNRVGIIKKGKLLQQDTVKSILEKTVRSVQVRCDREDEALDLVRRMEWIREAKRTGDGLQIHLASDQFARLHAELVKAGHEVSTFTPVRLTLEEYFLAS